MNTKTKIFVSSIRFRLMLLLGVMLVVLISYLYVVSVLEERRDESLYESRIESRKTIFEAFINSSSDHLNTFATDYTYWDDMVNFVEGDGQDTDFAEQNIEPSLTTFKADAIWIYNTDKKLIYDVNGFEEDAEFDPATDTPLKPDGFDELFKSGGVYDYYFENEFGVFKIFAASIHPTDDGDRVTPARGYFFVGKLVGKDYLADAGKSIEGEVSLISDPVKNPEVDGKFEEHTGQTSFTYPLEGPQNEPVGALEVGYVAADLRSASIQQDRLIQIGLILLVVAGVGSLILLFKWIMLPLEKVQRALSSHDEKSVSHLKSKKDEFGYIARLISLSLWQHRELESQKAAVERQVLERTQEVRDEKQILETILKNLPVGVLVVKAPGGEPILMNAAGEKISGRTAGVAGNNQHYTQAYDVIKEDGAPYPNDDLPLTITLKTGKTVMKDDMLLRRPDGTTVAVRAITTPIREQDGSFTTAVSVFEDISEERNLERSRDEFFSIASHELRTPLTAIRGNTSLIQEYFDDQLKDPNLREMIGDIHESSVRLIEIVNDFLDTSRLEQKRMKFESEPFDIVPVAESVIKEFQVTSSRQNTLLEVKKPASPLPLVFADRDRTRQILINLVGNAMKFTERGNITLSFVVEGDFVKVIVSDTGQGMSSEAQALLFKKFEQTGSSVLTRDSVQGTGLGLYISKLITEQMEGHIKLESSTPGVGTTFSFTLPIVKMKDHPEQHPPEATVPEPKNA